MSSSVQALLKSTPSTTNATKGRSSALDLETDSFSAELGRAKKKAKTPEPAEEPKSTKTSRSKKADKSKPREDEAEESPVESAETKTAKPAEPTADDQATVDGTETAEAPEAEKPVEHVAEKSDDDAAALLAVGVPTAALQTEVTEAVAEESTTAGTQAVAAVQAKPAGEEAADATATEEAAATDPTLAKALKGDKPLPEGPVPETEAPLAPKAKREAAKPDEQPTAPADAAVQTVAKDDKPAETKEHAALEKPSTEVPQAAPKVATDATAIAKPQAVEAPPEARFAQDNHDSIVKGVQTQLLPRGGTMQIRLDPPELGALNVILTIKDGVATASFQTNNDQATQALSHSLSQLKTAMESTGITVDKLQVQQAPKNQDSQSSKEDNQQRGQPGGDEMARQQEQQRKEMLRRMWRRLNVGSDPLDMVA